MNAKSKKLVFFGNERLATGVTTKAPLLRGLLKAGYEVGAIVISQRLDQASRQKRTLEIEEVARQNNIPIVSPTNLTEVIADLAKFEAAAGVLAAYGRIIPQAILDIFPIGIINIHPSLLPKYRGSSPIEQAILEAAEKTGVSLMRLVAEMDAGPVYATAHLSLAGSETKQGLFDKLDQLGADLLVENLPAILSGSLTPQPQSGNEVTYTPRLSKADGVIDWQKPPAQLEREVRTYLGWPKSQAKLFGNDVIITKVRVAEGRGDGELVMPAGDGWLEIQELIAPSGRTMSGNDFLRGYQK